MNNFTIYKEYNPCNNKYLSFFIFKGNVYPIYSFVTLTEKGSKAIDCCGLETSVLVEDHYFAGCIERWSFKVSSTILTRQNFSFDFFAHIEEYVEEVKADPLPDRDKYIKYIEDYKHELYKNALSEDEMQAIHIAVKNEIPLDCVLPNKLLGTDKEKQKPMFKDWEVPELIIGWIAFIVFYIFTFALADIIFRLFVQIVSGFIFGFWRQYKINGG